jgi:hypothetical protein
MPYGFNTDRKSLLLKVGLLGNSHMRFVEFPIIQDKLAPSSPGVPCIALKTHSKLILSRQRLLKNHFLSIGYSVSASRKPTFLSVYGRKIPCILFYPDSGTDSANQ